MKVNHVFAGIPVTDFAAARDWYERLFGGEPDLVPHATIAELAGRGIATGQVEPVNGMRRTAVHDADGNKISYAAPTGGTTA